ncbi:YfhD family protein [Paenibacillus rigui]|uniref:YfhD family protein n=1 Tax=Paenibacillus rigui TaxID=554312 RepID=A0A229URJ4_9BACL|nr:YfhD family protein [Paenibacillus rigui]OXM86126.1 hypothetical protein CF651_12995 [Paenibacillus rigui]
MVKQSKEQFQQNHRQLPIAKNEDVEFSSEAADNEDLEALERSKEADARQQS